MARKKGVWTHTSPLTPVQIMGTQLFQQHR